MGRMTRLFCLLFTLLFTPHLVASASDIIVRCGLVSLGKPTTLTLSCDKPFEVRAKDDTTLTTVDKGEVVVKADPAGITLTGVDGLIGQYPAPVRCSSKEVSALFKVAVTSPKKVTKLYRGILEISKTNGLMLVCELPLEDYVRGVIPVEVGKNMLPESQKAQVVAIRTYALTSMQRHKDEGYNVCDTTNCQGFAGATKDAPWVDAVLEATRGQVVIYGGKLIHAVFSTDCGGMTRNNEDAGFGDTPWPYLRAVVDAPGEQVPSSKNQGPESNVQRSTSNVQLPTSNAQSPASNVQAPAGDPGVVLGSRVAAAPASKSELGNPSLDYCASDPNHTWTKTYTLDELDRIFASGYSSKIGKLQSVEFVDYDVSGRPKSAVLKGDKDEVRLTSIQFRSLMGVNIFKSMRMTATVADDGKYVFNGRGFGHGVGLCAYGTNGLAKAGMNYVDILKFYYKGVEIKPISECGFIGQ